MQKKSQTNIYNYRISQSYICFQSGFLKCNTQSLRCTHFLNIIVIEFWDGNLVLVVIASPLTISESDLLYFW